jgi:hypothetical protein
MPVAISIPLDLPPSAAPAEALDTCQMRRARSHGVWDCKHLELIEGELIDRMERNVCT